MIVFGQLRRLPQPSAATATALLLLLSRATLALAAGDTTDTDVYYGADDHDEDHHHAVTAVLFPWFAEIIGVLTFFVLARYCHFLPYTAVMFLIGTLMGVAVTARGYASSELAVSIVQWANIDGHVLLLVFLPGLLFKDAFEVNFHLFKKAFWQLLIMAFPMVLAGTALVACVAKYVFPYDWSWMLCLTFGSILAATDPVAVSVLLNEVGAPPRLKMHVSGESLLNDGSAVVFFTIFASMFLFELGIDGFGQDVTVGEGFAMFFRMSIGGALIGIAFGFGLMLLLFLLDRRLNKEENIVQVAAAISLAYLSFYVAEVLAHCSGVIAVVFTGITTQAFGSNMINDRHMMEAFVELVEWLLNTLLFVLAGAIFGHVVADGKTWYAQDWGYLFALWALLNVIRFFLMFSAYPLLSRIGLKSNLAEVTFHSFGGLRGAVGIALALALEAEVLLATGTAGQSQAYVWVGTLFGHVGGVSFLTLVINGSLAAPLLIKLGLAESTAIRKRVVEHFERTAKEKVLNTFIRLLADPRFHAVDMNVVTHHVPILKDLTLDEFEKGVEKNRANTLPSAYTPPDIKNVLPYLLKGSKEGTVDVEKSSVLLDSFSANAVDDGSRKATASGIDFDALKTLYMSAHPESDPSKHDYSGILISAAAKGDVDSLRKLLSNSAVDVNSGDYDGRTALHLAAGEGKTEVIKLLLSHKANVNCEDRWGNRPLDDALRSKHKEAAALLREHGALPGKLTENSDLVTAAAAGDVDEVRRLLASEDIKETDINAGDYDQRTGLHLAAGEGHAEIVELLCQHGACITVTDRWGTTPLDDALRAGNQEVVDVLNRYAKRTHLTKTNVGTQDMFGKTGRGIELRMIFIETLRQSYDEQVERGELDGRGVLDNVLFGSLDSAAIDAANGIPLDDWEATDTGASEVYVEHAIRSAYSLKGIGSLSLKAVQTNLSIRRTLAFIAAHTLAQQRFSLELSSSGTDLSEFEAAKRVILEESQDEVAKAKAFLETFEPEETRGVLSHLCCLILLNEQARYFHYLSSAGLLKPKEANHFIEHCDHDIVGAKTCGVDHHPGELSVEDKQRSFRNAGLEISSGVMVDAAKEEGIPEEAPQGTA